MICKKHSIQYVNAKEYCDLVESSEIEHYRLGETIKIKDNGSKLVSLLEIGFDLVYEPSVLEGYRYLVREELVEKISRISAKLEQDDKRLVIRSAWRSFAHQKLLWDTTVLLMQRRHPEASVAKIHDIVSNYVVSEKTSTHSTGGALDALILNRKTNRILDFGTNEGYDIRLGRECYPYHPDVSELAQKNRALLIGLFEAEDFVCDLKEYWHFDYGNIGWAIEKGKNQTLFGIIEEC